MTGMVGWVKVGWARIVFHGLVAYAGALVLALLNGSSLAAMAGFFGDCMGFDYFAQA